MNCVKWCLTTHIKKPEIKPATQKAERADAGRARRGPITEMFQPVILSGSVTPTSTHSQQ